MLPSCTVNDFGALQSKHHWIPLWFSLDGVWQHVTLCWSHQVFVFANGSRNSKTGHSRSGDLRDITGGAFMSALTHRYETTVLMQLAAMLIIVHLCSRRLNYTIYGGEGGDTVWIHISFTLWWRREAEVSAWSPVITHISPLHTHRCLIMPCKSCLTQQRSQQMSWVSIRIYGEGAKQRDDAGLLQQHEREQSVSFPESVWQPTPWPADLWNTLPHAPPRLPNGLQQGHKVWVRAALF